MLKENFEGFFKVFLSHLIALLEKLWAIVFSSYKDKVD